MIGLWKYNWSLSAPLDIIVYSGETYYENNLSVQAFLQVRNFTNQSISVILDDPYSQNIKIDSIEINTIVLYDTQEIQQYLSNGYNDIRINFSLIDTNIPLPPELHLSLYFNLYSNFVVYTKG